MDRNTNNAHSDLAAVIAAAAAARGDQNSSSSGGRSSQPSGFPPNINSNNGDSNLAALVASMTSGGASAGAPRVGAPVAPGSAPIGGAPGNLSMDTISMLLGQAQGQGGRGSQYADLQALRLRAMLGGPNGGLGGGSATFLAPPPQQHPPPSSLAQQLAEIEKLRMRADMMASAATTNNPQMSSLFSQSQFNHPSVGRHPNIFEQVMQMDQERARSSSGSGGADANSVGRELSVPTGPPPRSDPPAVNGSAPTSTSMNPYRGGTLQQLQSLIGGGGGGGADPLQSAQARNLLRLLQVHESAAGPDVRFQQLGVGGVQGNTIGQLARAPPSVAPANRLLREPSIPNRILKLPPTEEGDIQHYISRLIVPLGVDEDANFLSERQVFIRAELLEVIRASHEEVLARSSSKSIAYQQVGIRCRYCAHLQPGSRAIRASAFPSSIPQMYQSFTMMVRDHFGACSGVPPEKKERFNQLKGLTSPSSSLSRQYWIYAAKKLGMKDTECGIIVNKATQALATRLPPFGTTTQESESIKVAPAESLVEAGDVRSISPYLHVLMTNTQIVHLLPSERVGKRKDAVVGLPGFGCRHCVKSGRLGFCRMFPLNKRSLPDKVNDLYNHMVRCPQCPSAIRGLLENRRAEIEGSRNYAERDREFVDRIWYKLGRDTDEAFKKA